MVTQVKKVKIRKVKPQVKGHFILVGQEHSDQKSKKLNTVKFKPRSKVVQVIVYVIVPWEPLKTHNSVGKYQNAMPVVDIILVPRLLNSNSRVLLCDTLPTMDGLKIGGQH